MLRTVSVRLTLLAAAGLLACAPRLPQRVEDPAVVEFRGRKIDLHPYLEGSPFAWRLIPRYDAKRWIGFDDRGGQRVMRAVRLPERGEVDLAKGTTLAPGVDWSGRNYWGMQFHAPSQSMIVWGDERADEANQLYAVPLDGSPMKRITDAKYVAGFGVDSSGRIAWLSRTGVPGSFSTCLHVMSPSFEDREVVCDAPAEAFAVGAVSFTPAGDALLGVRTDGLRNRTGLARVDLRAKTITALLPDAVRAAANPLDGWLDERRFLFVSDESGHGELWRYEGTGATQLTRLSSEIASASLLEIRGRKIAALVLSHPEGSELVLVDPETGASVLRETIDDNSEVLDASGNRFYLVRDSRKTWLRVEEWIFRAGEDGRLSHTTATRFEPPRDAERAVSQCNVERVEIPTFDRTLSAWLMTPKNAPAAGDRFALVEAFYGGENVYDLNAEVICAAGGIVLSPSIRGSSGFGAQFAALNDGDMGGDEVVDLMRCGKWLEERFSLEPKRIGLWGGSHGGYETMRALTWPDGVNGKHEHFAFGFGMSHGGISDLLAFFRESRIPDWLRREAGDPVADREKIDGRSPIRHVDLLASPLLLTAGANDTRVPPAQSKAFADAAKALGKDVTYVELEGQGHHVTGVAANRALWDARFRFLAHALPR